MYFTYFSVFYLLDEVGLQNTRRTKYTVIAMAMTAVPQKTIILKIFVALISSSKFILPYALRVYSF